MESSRVQFCINMVDSPVESSKVQFLLYIVGNPVESSFVSNTSGSPVEFPFVSGYSEVHSNPVESSGGQICKYCCNDPVYSEVQWNPVEFMWIICGMVKYCPIVRRPY